MESGHGYSDLSRPSLSIDFKCGYLLGFGYKQIQICGYQHAAEKTLALANQYPELQQRFAHELSKLGFQPRH